MIKLLLYYKLLFFKNSLKIQAKNLKMNIKFVMNLICLS